MRNTPNVKKILKRFLVILIALTLIIAGVLYYIVIHNFKESIQYIVKTESNGKYAFDAGAVKVSIKNKHIFFSNASLHCIDTVNVDTHYEVYIPGIDFSFLSWRDIIFNKKLKVQQFTLQDPSIVMHTHRIKERALKKNKEFKTSDILRFLEKTLAHFNVESFNLRNASFTYSRTNGPSPFRASNINFALSNFKKVDNNDDHLLGADNISLHMGKQNWILPDGSGEISFKGLNFISKGQRFEIDSFALLQYKTPVEEELKFTASKFFFNSRHLPAIYQREELLIDTLYCLNPVLSLIDNGINKNKKETVIVDNDKTYLFKLIQIKVISVLDAELLINNKFTNAPKTENEKNNIFIYNLVMDNEKNGEISTDSVRIKLKAMEFYSKDSLFKLRINDFALNNKTAFFGGVSYGPSEYNLSTKGINFTAPSFVLQQVSIPDLIRRRLKANNAVLTNPIINLSPGEKNSKKSILNSPKDLSFFKTMNSVSDVIDVNELNIINGSLNYKVKSKQPLTLTIKGFNAGFRLNQLFSSDHVLDVEHSISRIEMKEIDLLSKVMKARITGYQFTGAQNKSQFEKINFDFKNGTAIEGHNASWQYLDLARFQELREIKAPVFSLQKLSVKMGEPEKTNKQSKGNGFPFININKVFINALKFTQANNETNISFTGNSLALSNFRGKAPRFTWDNINVNLNDFLWNKNDMQASVNSLSLSKNTHYLKGVKYNAYNEDGNTHLLIPELKVNMDLHSTDFYDKDIRSITAKSADLKMITYEKGMKIHANPISIPLSLSLDNLDIQKVSMQHITVAGHDSTFIESELAIRGKNLKSVKVDPDFLQYDYLSVNATNSFFRQDILKMDIPLLDVQLANGNLMSKGDGDVKIGGSAEVSWNNASLKYITDTASLEAKGLSGDFSDKNFSVNNKKAELTKLLRNINFSGDSLHFQNRKLGISAKNYSWNSLKKSLSLHYFNFKPTESREETFAAAKWQTDYLTLKGDSIKISGIEYENGKDSSLLVKTITTVGLEADLSRDKRLPFQHGNEKLMPTKLIQTIPFPVKIDSVLMKNNKVNYHEYSVATQKWITIPLNDLNGYVTNISNDKNEKDSLGLLLNADLLGNYIRGFSYKESYADSLSGFVAENHLSAIDLTSISKVSHSMAGAQLVRGSADTLYAHWHGNKYAAKGTMNFHFKDLKVKFYDLKNIDEQGSVTKLKTLAANLFLPNKRARESVIYYERDREKFIFNYWIRTQASGFLSTIGLKSSKKLRKEYLKNRKRFSLD